MFNHSYKRFVLLFLAIVLIAAGGYFIWSRFFKYDPVKAYETAEKKYVEAMKADTYGGKTPQETLDLFVKALRAGDVELASKYFLIDENASREEYLAALKTAKDANRLEKIADIIAKAVILKDRTGLDGSDAYFGTYQNGKLIADFTLRLNKYTGVWKIESL